MKNTFLSVLLLFSLGSILAQSKPLDINISSSDVSINAKFVHKTATKERVEDVLGKTHTSYSFAPFGESYIYDNEAISFRWDSTSKKLLSIYMYFSERIPEPYQPKKKYTGKLNCIGMEISENTRQLDLVSTQFHLITKAEKDWSSIEIDKPKFTLVFDFKLDGGVAQSLQSLSIYFRHDTLPPTAPMNLYANTNPDARGADEEIELLIGGKDAYRQGYQSLNIPEMAHIGEDLAPTEMENLLFKEGVKAVIAKWEEIQKNTPNSPKIEESVMNSVGYRLVSEKKYEDAILLFEKNVASHPNSYNAYDSLGEAQFYAGKMKEAYQSYKKSLSLNPSISGSTYQNSETFLKNIVGGK